MSLSRFCQRTWGRSVALVLAGCLAGVALIVPPASGSAAAEPAQHPIGPSPAFANTRWIVGGNANSALGSIRQLDPALAQTYFDNSRTDVLSGGEPPASQVPRGWSAVPSQHYTRYGPCSSGQRCASFSTDVSSGTISSSKIPVVMYDNENWRYTPQNEKVNVCSYMKKFARLATANHFTSIVAPDQNLASPGVITSYQGGESENWQTYLRLGLGTCASASGAPAYHIMAQPFQTHWCGGQGGACEGSEADFTSFVTQAALQGRAVNPHLLLTAGLSTNLRYHATPQALYRDSLNVRKDINGFWLNVPGHRPNAGVAVQYLEMLSGLVPFYFGPDRSLSASFPTDSESEGLPLSASGGQTVFESGPALPAGTVIPAGTYEFEPWTDGSSGSATVSIEVGYCAPPGCSSRTPVIGPGSWNAHVPAGDAGSPLSYTTTSPTRLPTGGPYRLYVAVRVRSGGGFNLRFNSGSASASLAVPRPSSDPAVPRTSVMFARGGGRLSVGRPASGRYSTLSLARAGNTATFWTRQALAPGDMVPAGAWEFQYWTDGNGSSAKLDLQAGYCNEGCTHRVPIIGPSAGWQPTVTAGAKGAASPGGAFTTKFPTVLPLSRSPYHLYWTVTVATPGNFDLRYGSASAPTNLASPLLLPAIGGSRCTVSGAERFFTASSPSQRCGITDQPYASLPAAFDNAGITTAADPAAGDFAGTGLTYPAGALRRLGFTPGAVVNEHGMSFTWPNVAPGLPDNVVASGQTIALSGQGSELGFLGASDYGDASGQGMITYTDGTTQRFTLNLTDYYRTAPAPGDQIVAVTPYRHSPHGTSEHSASISFTSVPIQPDKTVAYVTLPNVSAGVTKGRTAMHIFAMSIGG